MYGWWWIVVRIWLKVYKNEHTFVKNRDKR